VPTTNGIVCLSLSVGGMYAHGCAQWSLSKWVPKLEPSHQLVQGPVNI